MVKFQVQVKVTLTLLFIILSTFFSLTSQAALDDINQRRYFPETFVARNQEYSTAGQSLTCWTCKHGFASLIFQIRYLKSPESKVRDRLRFLCPIFRLWGALKIHDLPDSQVCSHLIDRFSPTIYYILKNRPGLNAEAFCGFTMQYFGCNTLDPYLEWSISDLIPDELPSQDEDDLGNNELESERLILTAEDQETSSNGQAPLKILHLADIHIDLRYEPNTEAICQNSILCCHNDSVQLRSFGFDAPFKSKKSGAFGDPHRCDPPLRLLDLTLQNVVETHPEVELIYMTGDVVPRNVDTSTKQANIKVIQRVSDLIYKYYPNTTVIPALGNHESHPVNFFSPPNVPEEINTRWVYNVTWNAWMKRWIPMNQKKRFLKGGFYCVEISRDFKIIVLNTNICYGLNLWAMYNVKDPEGQLSWLIQELATAEAIGQSVHIVGHVPPTTHCNKMWSRNFYNIVSRFRSVIKAQFYGHTHFDELRVFYSPTELAVPINSLFISPSLTAYERNNPAFKIFYVDAPSPLPTLLSSIKTNPNNDNNNRNETEVTSTRKNTYSVVDYELYVFDLEDANTRPKETPRWFPLYRASVDYEIPGTNLQNLADFVNRMAFNKTLFDLYYQNSKKFVPRQRKTSTQHERNKILCNIVRPFPQHEKECNRLLGLSSLLEAI